MLLGRWRSGVPSSHRWLLDENRIKILVDLDGVSYIDSSGVGMMVAQLKTVRQRGGDMRLMRLNSRGQRMFTLLKLRSTFEGV
jgi:anti-sigma B factor antagonist